ncbi:MAG: hypothetical protein S4CHLAM2_01860 [Chlamydiales bacterium]|nr:hypothetical protein [Chlamydiales bacterium]
MSSISSVGSSVAWTSPIKSSPPPREPHSFIPRRLFDSEHTNTPPSYHSLSALYEIDFFQPSDDSTLRHFFDMRDCVLQIETYLHDHPTHPVDVLELRARIKTMIKDSTVESSVKLGELGLILFYLDYPDRTFPIDESSLIALRANEMKNEATRLLQAHAAITEDERIPSGSTHYLLRSFAHMALTSTQVYNKGGLYALKTILESPRFTLASFLEPEHHTHILIIVGQLLNQSPFESLFRRRVEVHPDLQNVVRIDLKLCPEDPVSSTHVLWDCLMFLFTDIRQIYRPNCYAIGGLIYATENAPYKTLDAMLNWLTQGHYDCGEGISVPIRPILEKRLIYAQDLRIKLETQKALCLNTFQHIMDTMRADSISSNSSEVAPLRTILNAASGPSHISYTESLYYAYKYNALVHLALAIMEFTWNNTTLDHVCVKESFSNWVHSQLSEHLKRHFPSLDFTPFTHNFHLNLRKKVWFENCSETDISLSRRSLRVGTQHIKDFEGSLTQLKKTFADSLRLFYLERSKYGLINSFSDLKEALVEIAKDSIPSSNLDNGVLAFTLHFLCSSTFTKRVAERVEQQIALPGIQASSLLKANLLLCRQQGGYPEDVLQKVFGLRVTIETIRGRQTAYDFLGALRSQLQSIERVVLESMPRLVAFTQRDHIWTLSPAHLRTLLQPTCSYHSLVQLAVFNHAHHHMQQVVPQVRKVKILQRLGVDSTGNIFSNKLTYQALRSTLLRIATKKRKGLTLKTIDEEFGKILTTQLNLSSLLDRLHIQLPLAKWSVIKKYLPQSWLHPYQIAQKIREALIKVSEKILDPYEIEVAICREQGLPISFNIGDLNWSEGPYREKPSHTYLIVRYNWARKILSYYTRYREEEKINCTNAFCHFEIQHSHHW